MMSDEELDVSKLQSGVLIRENYRFRLNTEFTVSGGCDDDASSYCELDLTPGSLEVWRDLPNEIKYDPALAPFKQLYEESHGKLDRSDTNLEDNRLLEKQEKHVLDTAKAEKNADLNKSVEDRLVPPDLQPEDVRISNNQTRVTYSLRILKLTALIACWMILTVSLLLNSEKKDVVLHTAVSTDEVKDYVLKNTLDDFEVLVTLAGPLNERRTNSSQSLEVWLHRSFANGSAVNEQISSSWVVALQTEADIDFSPSVTKSHRLRIPKTNVLYNADGVSKVDMKIDQPVHSVQNNTTHVKLRMRSNSRVPVSLTVSYQLDPVSREHGLIFAVLLLFTLYILIVFEVVNRTIAALLSSTLGVAVLAVCGERPSLPELISWLDVETLLLLFSMMILVAILAETGLFDYLAVVAFEVTGGQTWPLINCLCFFTAIFSTFLDNVTTVLLMTPVTIRLCEVMSLNPVPVLMSMVIFSNVGGAATPVGDPPNVIIASHPSILQENINFTSFTLHMGLGIVFVSIQTYFQLRYMFRDMSKLRHSIPQNIVEMQHVVMMWKRIADSLSPYSRDEKIVIRALNKKLQKLEASLKQLEAGGSQSKSDPLFTSTLDQMKEKYYIRDKLLLIKSSVCVAFVVTVFFLHAIPQLQSLSLGWTAFLGALLLLLLAEREDLEPVLARVEWSTLLFFAALFVLMEVLSKLGLIAWIGNLTESIVMRVSEESRLAVALMLILWVSGLASAFVDNIPLTTMMVRVTAALSSGTLSLPLAPLAWALSFGACLGGNGTLIGASANVVCAGVAEQHGYRFTFMQFLKIGFPIMIGNLVVASVYLLLCHCVFSWH